jgi:hypothetical protein
MSTKVIEASIKEANPLTGKRNSKWKELTCFDWNECC